MLHATSKLSGDLLSSVRRMRRLIKGCGKLPNKQISDSTLVKSLISDFGAPKVLLAVDNLGRNRLTYTIFPSANVIIRSQPFATKSS